MKKHPNITYLIHSFFLDATFCVPRYITRILNAGAAQPIFFIFKFFALEGREKRDGKEKKRESPVGGGGRDWHRNSEADLLGGNVSDA